MPGASLSAVARRYGLHPSQVFAWRKAAREGNTEAARSGLLDCVFAPVVVTGSRQPPSGYRLIWRGTRCHQTTLA
jgi:transposase